MVLIRDIDARIAELEIRIRRISSGLGRAAEGTTHGCTNGCTGACPDPTDNCTYGCTNGCTNGCTEGCGIKTMIETTNQK